MDKRTFLAGYKPRFGDRNPTPTKVAFWDHMIRTGDIAWTPKDKLGLDPFDYAPSWCFDRFGQTRTRLPDGRVVCVAGEHEDSYDPDFYIYNDVIVIHPDGEITIYGYPTDVFPPTDGHTATLVDDTLWLIGNLGYAHERGNRTPVFTLDTKSMKIAAIQTKGYDPGWVSRHRACFDSERNVIIIGPGERFEDEKVITQPAELDLTTLVWTLIDETSLPWRRKVPVGLVAVNLEDYGQMGSMDAARRAIPPGHELFGDELWPVGEHSYVTVYEIVGGPHDGRFAVAEDFACVGREPMPGPFISMHDSLQEAIDVGVPCVKRAGP